ncbi:hypothetical protein Zmor_001198 [Zophobas morio]|uniref:DNA-directed RNA polymerase I subunit RPA49 n=1 Tax=Zophobas morio TaxID=2755281 RepID=A0AA38J211_9CUCU|nr:hypothetical protein Zmor_001198 [Zophobas morio]
MVHAVSEIEDNEDGIRPVIIQFQNSELQEGEEGKLHTGIYQKSPKTTIVGVATKNILYTGEITKDDETADLNNRFLLISNRKTGKVRLVAVDTAVVTPQCQPKKSSDVTDSSTLNPNNSISQLNKEFGSKKIKRITEQRERLKMNIEDVQEQLEQTVASVNFTGSESFVVESAENDSAYRPPINRDASTREQVYVLHDIVPENVLDSLEEEATNALSSDLDNIELTPFIKERLTELQNSTSDSVIGTAKILLYVDYLMKFINKPAKAITKKFVICQSSVDVNSHILDNFSVVSNTGRTRPLSMRDKTICYMVVLLMIALDYQVNMEALSKNIKLGVKKLQEMGRILAFSAHSKDKNVMILKIPLPPAVSLSPRKRKR